MPRIATPNPVITPEWNRASRYGALIIIIVCTVVALRPLMGGGGVGHARPVSPATTHPRLPARCARALEGRMIFISDGPSTMTPSVRCYAQKPVPLGV